MTSIIHFIHVNLDQMNLDLIKTMMVVGLCWVFFTETTGRPIVQEHLFMLTAINQADIDSLELLGKLMSPDVLQLPFIL